jgi:hypothetical protein
MLFSIFTPHIEIINDDKIRDFTVESLSKAPEFYSNISKYIEETDLAVQYATTFLDVLDVEDYIRDCVISAVLIQGITKFKLNDEDDIVEDIMSTLSVRQTVISLMPTVGSDTFDNILRLVESSRGYNSPIPQVMPSLEDPVYIWILPFANQLAKERA